MDDAPWFVASDVCRSLGLAPAAVTGHVSRLRANDVRRVDRTTLSLPKGAPMVVISEAGLYSLIQRSDKPEARAFQDWVNGEVLPSIRKTGSYALADAGREAMPLPMDIAEAMAAQTAAHAGRGPKSCTLGDPSVSAVPNPSP